LSENESVKKNFLEKQENLQIKVNLISQNSSLKSLENFKMGEQSPSFRPYAGNRLNLRKTNKARSNSYNHFEEHEMYSV
jgi:hypothetical protein